MYLKCGGTYIPKKNVSVLSFWSTAWAHLQTRVFVPYAFLTGFVPLCMYLQQYNERYDMHDSRLCFKTLPYS